ncbi:MAG: PBPRA1643 family SWIM/SEC-C metal-binding motif protein [Halioglobus sp.]
MSDKFFFKGRQESRVDHKGHGYTTKGSLKSGSKKYPLQLIVGSQQRKDELLALASDNELFVEVQVKEDCESEVNVTQLMALVNKGETAAVANTPSRNDPCSCGSGKKYKKCCG